ncbi:MAG TPA: response regulator [Holophagaceae bacterium]|nr:response regulator [Holophagaceae bacterium]
MTGSALKKILLVEDDPDIRTVAQLSLETLGGFELRLAPSGQEALDMAPGFAPDLFILDVMMPGLDGPGTLAGLRRIKTLTDTPVIFMTAKVQPQEVAHLKSLGALEIISKPFDPMALPDLVRTIWSRRHG